MMALTQNFTSKVESAESDQPAMTLQRLRDRLDGLWMIYLQYLDTYRSSQDSLQQQMSAGFISLARANFNARNGVRRYGKDFYHERAVAARTIFVNVGEHGRARVEVLRDERSQSSVYGEAEATGNAREEREESVLPRQQPSPPKSPGHRAENVEQSLHEEEKTTDPSAGATGDKESSASSRKPLESDPLHWFGILVPRELRSAQSSFSSAVDNAVVDCINSAKGMRETEVEIRKLQKEVRKAEREVKS